ncbi:amidase signature enzyme [Corynespora cassiicola Philippines]|uniref:Amidase signature enzyme n=1 Tax=Corynespora cassiicola Philippines TaxID=1448308 RepID=A0A2T2NJS2_CORCC|nr:amidase signature enzyme [Corynespora cassiicola Philippines]
MSVVFLNTGPPTVDAKTFKDITSTHNVVVPESDEPHYLHLLNGLDASISLIESLPAYTDPRLLPDPSTLPRSFKKLGGDADLNPLNTWSHQTEVKSAIPQDTRLAGKTIAVKDNVSIAGIPLTGGTFPELLGEKPEYPVPGIDAVVVKRALESGATVRGSANCEHFSMSPLSFTSASGPVHNAWLKGYTTGGSSSGCAAIVAATQVRAWRKKFGLPPNDEELGEGVDMAIGGDQGGSIRIPSAYAGVYGFKATHGLVPYTGIMGLIPMIDHTGPMTASLEDNALLLSVLAGYDGIDPRCTPETPLRKNIVDYAGLLEAWKEEKSAKGEWTAETAGRGLRVGIIKEGLEVLGLSDDVRAVVREAAAQFKAVGADVQEVSIPMHLVGPAIWTVVTRPYMFAMPHVTPPVFDQKVFEVLNKYNPAVVNMFFNSTLMNSRANVDQLLAKSIGLVQQLRHAYDTVLEDFDVLLTPVNPRVGSRHPEYSMSVDQKMEPAIGATLNTCQFNVTGHPALAMPAGWARAPDGPGMLPVGMQLVGKRWDETAVFKAAAAWERGGKGLDRWNGQLN